MRKIPPCKDCMRRVPGCHSMCSGFKAWKAEIEEQNRLKDKAKELDAITLSDRVKKAFYKKVKEGRK